MFPEVDESIKAIFERIKILTNFPQNVISPMEYIGYIAKIMVKYGFAELSEEILGYMSDSLLELYATELKKIIANPIEEVLIKYNPLEYN